MNEENKTVAFKNVGRGKKSWIAKTEGKLSYEWLHKQVTGKNALMSEDIIFTDSGGIFVGFRQVGEFITKEGE